MAADPSSVRSIPWRERRMRRRAEFLRVYDRGRKAGGRLATIFCLERPPGEDGEPLPWRLGITSSRKAGRRAVDRNRQRRLVREFFRRNAAAIPEGWDFVVNTRARLNEAGYDDLEKDLRRTLERLRLAPVAPESPARPENRT